MNFSNVLSIQLLQHQLTDLFRIYRRRSDGTTTRDHYRSLESRRLLFRRGFLFVSQAPHSTARSSLGTRRSDDLDLDIAGP